MLTLSLLLISSLAAEARTPDAYRAFDRVQTCEGQDDQGRTVKFRLEEKKFTGTRYLSQQLRKLRVDGDKLGKANLLTGEAGCGDGDRGSVSFKVFEGKFKLRLDCRKVSVRAKGLCAGADREEGEYDSYEETGEDTLVGD